MIHNDINAKLRELGLPAVPDDVLRDAQNMSAEELAVFSMQLVTDQVKDLTSQFVKAHMASPMPAPLVESMGLLCASVVFIGAVFEEARKPGSRIQARIDREREAKEAK